MKISEYFEKKKGRGVIATADSEGNVGVAVYARPHFIDEKTVVFIMADRLMHKNVQSNPHAAYLFLESGDRYIGKRLYLELSRNIIVEQTPDGLRIQIIDQEGRSMFNAGDASHNERARRLLIVVASVITQLPNRITISGHTDGSAPSGRYTSNFDLSAARANEARRVLQANGIPADRIYQVAGRADSEPLFVDDPTMPGNRRIAITLLREAPPLPANQDSL